MDFDEHTKAPEGGSDRAFGLVFTALFAIIGLWPLLSGAGPRTWSMALALAFAAAALLYPRALAPLNRWWTRFGLLLNRVVSPVALMLLYLGAFLPTGLLMRLFGKRPLALRYDREASSYWMERTPPGRADDGMKNQF